MLTVCRFLLGFTLVIPGVLLTARDRIDTATLPLRGLAADAVVLIPGIEERVFGTGWSWSTALVMGVAIAGLGFLVVGLAFSWWEKQEVRHVFRREGYLALPSPMLLTLGLAALAAEVALFAGLERWEDLPLGAGRAAIVSLVASGLSWIAPIWIFSEKDLTEVRTQAFRNEWWTNNRTFGTAALAFLMSFPAAVAFADNEGEGWVLFALLGAGFAVVAGLLALAPFTWRLRRWARRITVAGEPRLRARTRTGEEALATWKDILERATYLRKMAKPPHADRAELFERAFWENKGRALAADAAPELHATPLVGDTRLELLRELAFFNAKLAISLPEDDPERIACLERRRTHGQWFERIAARRALSAKR